MRSLLVIVIAVVAWDIAPRSHAQTPVTEEVACARVQKHVAARAGLPSEDPISSGWYCEFVSYDQKEWFVVALRSSRECESPCSNLMGWFAINRETEALHEFDVGEYRVGRELKDE